MPIISKHIAVKRDLIALFSNDCFFFILGDTLLYPFYILWGLVYLLFFASLILVKYYDIQIIKKKPYFQFESYRIRDEVA
jgi:hypothetical protein